MGHGVTAGLSREPPSVPGEVRAAGRLSETVRFGGGNPPEPPSRTLGEDDGDRLGTGEGLSQRPVHGRQIDEVEARPAWLDEALLRRGALTCQRAGVAAHSGSACSSESLEPSPVLEAMGVLIYSVDKAEDVRATVDAATRAAFNGGQAVAVLLRQKLIGIKSFGKK